MKNRICELLGIEVPIILAPMAVISSPALVAAVSNAGGLGSLALGACSPAEAAALIDQVKASTNRPYCVNFFCHAPAQADSEREAQWLNYLAPYFAQFDAAPPTTLREIYKSFVADEGMLQVVLATRPPAVSFHFGLPPASTIAALKKAGCVLLATATTIEEAQIIEAAGIDIIVAQGYEAGGHRGTFNPEQGDTAIGTFALVQLIARHTALPVVAAGGIMDGQGIAAAMALGAGAVQMGTAFILCPESAANPTYRQMLKSPRARTTAVTSAISGRAARGMTNRYFTEIDAADRPAVPNYPIAYDAAKSLHAAASKRGSNEFAANWAGQGAALIREMPAADMVRTLLQELEAVRTSS
ncbi:MAG TPA: nitronate monooxygenase [Burkholderiaceae bacterium]|jgi:nitronate monooxygenase